MARLDRAIHAFKPAKQKTQIAHSLRPAAPAAQKPPYSKSFLLLFFKKEALSLSTLALLTACGSAGPVSGAAVGLGIGGVTANPLIGYAAGVGTEAGITALQKYLSRKLHQGEQDNIAAEVAQLQPGQHAPWKIAYKIPIDGEHGDVTVTRIIKTPFTTCKEAAFTVIEGNRPNSPRGLYITSACARPDGVWSWSQAEPATSRWGFLQ
jgi:uncharacterized membrane protein